MKADVLRPPDLGGPGPMKIRGCIGYHYNENVAAIKRASERS